MSRIIAVIGNKGGTGKTTITQMLCHGLGLLGKRSMAVLTDAARDPLSSEARRYTPCDGRSPDRLRKAVGLFRSMHNLIGVIDGGGNRPQLDREFYEMADLVLLPFRDSHEDLRTVRRDLDSFPEALGVPSQWPSNPWAQMAAERSIDQLIPEYRPRLTEPVYALSASKLLLQDPAPQPLPTALNNLCRRLARDVLARLETIDNGPAETRRAGTPEAARRFH